MARTDFEMRQEGAVLHGRFIPEGGASSFSLPLLAQIGAFAERIEADDTIRAAIITGTGRSFNIGTDLSQIETGLADGVQFRRYLDAFNATMERLERVPVPVIAAVNGLTRAGGLEVVLVCDIALIADDARICDGHAAQFAIPAGGSTQRLPRRIGAPRAKELIWSGRFLDAAEAVSWGLCQAAYPADELMARAEALAATFTDKPRACLREIKSLVDRAATMSVADGSQLEMQAFLNYVAQQPYVRDAFEAFTRARAARS